MEITKRLISKQKGICVDVLLFHQLVDTEAYAAQNLPLGFINMRK